MSDSLEAPPVGIKRQLAFVSSGFRHFGKAHGHFDVKPADRMPGRDRQARSLRSGRCSRATA